MVINETDRINALVSMGARSLMTNREFLEQEIRHWRKSRERRQQIAGERYYKGEHDIKKRKREVLGNNGEMVEMKYLPNNRIVDNQYALAVDNKTNYLVGNPITITTDNKQYGEHLRDIFGLGFMRKCQYTARRALNQQCSWIFPTHNDCGELIFQTIPGYELLPFWKDAEQTEVEAAIRLTEHGVYQEKDKTIEEVVDVFVPEGIWHYTLSDEGELIPDQKPFEPYAILTTLGSLEVVEMGSTPLIPFKYNQDGVSLLERTKTLQDAINLVISLFANNIEEDPKSTILVIHNYDGVGVDEFRKNLAEAGMVKVRSDSEGKGGVEPLYIEVKAENYKIALEIFKKALIENARSFDAKDDRIGANANQLNIQSMYSNIDLDANGMETEFQGSLKKLTQYINLHLKTIGAGDFSGEEVKYTFNRDVMINTTQLIEDCAKSEGTISRRTILEHHPFVDNPDEEEKRLEEERAKEVEDYTGAFPLEEADNDRSANSSKES